MAATIPEQKLEDSRSRFIARGLQLFIGAASHTCHAAVAIGCWNGAMESKVTTRQVLNDLAFTALAAFGTGGAVGGIAFLVVRFFLA